MRGEKEREGKKKEKNFNKVLMKSNLGIKVSLNIQFSCSIIVETFYKRKIILYTHQALAMRKHNILAFIMVLEKLETQSLYILKY